MMFCISIDPLLDLQMIKKVKTALLASQQLRQINDIGVDDRLFLHETELSTWTSKPRRVLDLLDSC